MTPTKAGRRDGARPTLWSIASNVLWQRDGRLTKARSQPTNRHYVADAKGRSRTDQPALPCTRVPKETARLRGCLTTPPSVLRWTRTRGAAPGRRTYRAASAQLLRP